MTESNRQRKVIVLTGSTGGFGRFLARELLKHEDVELILLVRAGSHEEASIRVQDIVGQDKRVRVYCSDLSQERLGLSQSDFNEITGNATHILHSAASVRFTLPLEQARLFNVKTTEQVLLFAKKCPKIVRFGYVGTALVAGNRSGTIREDEFEHTAGFKNTYEQSKYEAEQLVRLSIENLSTVIFRPPLIAPSSLPNVSGRSIVHALLLGANLVARGDIRFLPGSERSFVDIVDPKISAERIVTLLLKSKLSHMVYHITNAAHAPTVSVIRSMIEKKLQHSLPLDFCGSMMEYNEKVSRIPWYKFRARYAHKKIHSFIPELAYPKIYDNSHTLNELQIEHLGPDPITVVSQLIQ